MATRFKLSWRPNEGRFRKKYKGRYYHFPAPEGKLAGYSRCLREWQKLKREIDNRNEESEDQKKWDGAIALARVALEEARRDEDRMRWSWWYTMVLAFQKFHDDDNSYSLAADPDTVQDLRELLAFPRPQGHVVNPGPGDFPDVDIAMFGEAQLPAPWEVYSLPYDEPRRISSVESAAREFLKSKEREATAGKISPSRHEMLTRAVDDFLEAIGPTELQSLTGHHLYSYRDNLQDRIGKGAISPFTGRDYLAAVKQLVNWLYVREHIDAKPRCVEDRSFTIHVPQKEIVIFSPEEVRAIIDQAPEPLRLHLLLMANCGMTQKDIADLRHDETVLDTGTITRGRSKTKVQVVAYRLWDETLRLLRKHKSDHPRLVLTNSNGDPLWRETIKPDGKRTKTDNIKSAYNRLELKDRKPLKTFRASAASMLDNHPEFKLYEQHFLGHSPRTVAQKHYVTPSQERFDAAVRWLGEQYGF